MSFVVTAGEFLLPVYEYFCILWTLAFGYHFYRSFGKSKNTTICMCLFYMYF